MAKIINNSCQSCKYAEWEYVDAYRSGYWAICGCKKEEDEKSLDILKEHGYSLDDWESGEIGDTKECPLWEESKEDCYD